jgi:hypothetical protein
MKKLLVLALVLSMASMANAALWITVDGTAGSATPGETVITATPGATVTISIVGDNTGTASDTYGGTEFALGADLTGAGAALNIDNAVVDYAGNTTNLRLGGGDEGGELIYNSDPAPVFAQLMDVPPQGTALKALSGTLVHGITFVMGSDTVVIDLLNENWDTIYSQVTVNTPEPITVALLGLGGLFLRRRK